MNRVQVHAHLPVDKIFIRGSRIFIAMECLTERQFFPVALPRLEAVAPNTRSSSTPDWEEAIGDSDS